DHPSGDAPSPPPLPEDAYAFEDDGRQVTYRLAIGRRRGALPGNIVGAIANTARLPGAHINGVDIRANYSLVRLPAALPRAVIERLSRVRLRGQTLSLVASKSPPPPRGSPKPDRKGPRRPAR
ncbi:MAG: DbpA RNA binding domain-containing protein, partial [Burkholderiales bacterium]|nr:DbpA RNA binding domain-containing protein [Burkholderiales bacterium]